MMEITEQTKKISIAFALWLQDNRWFNFDEQAQKWCYTFEGGTYLGEGVYERNYMKTNNELWDKFITEYKLINKL